MDTHRTMKVMVKSLPEDWTPDHLLNFVEVMTSLTLADNGIQVFKGITHSALLTLEEPVAVEAVREAQQTLIQMPFIGQTLVLEAVTDTTCSVLVHSTDPHLSPDDAVSYFDNPQRSGRGEGEVKNCEMHLEVLLVVVQFSSPEAAAGVLAKGEHRINTGGEAVQVEPWYEQFHRPLLRELLARRGQKMTLVVTPKLTPDLMYCGHKQSDQPPDAPQPMFNGKQGLWGLGEKTLREEDEPVFATRDNSIMGEMVGNETADDTCTQTFPLSEEGLDDRMENLAVDEDDIGSVLNEHGSVLELTPNDVSDTSVPDTEQGLEEDLEDFVCFSPSYSNRSERWSTLASSEGRCRDHTSQRPVTHPTLPCSVTVGTTTITVKLGDITTEQVGAAVCVVGKTLNLKETAVGSTFLRKCPSLAQVLQVAGQSGGGNGRCRLVTTAVPGGTPLQMSTLLHAVLYRMPRHAVTKCVKQLVQQSLQLSVQYGLTSIAFPPLGVGRRFGYGRYTVASAMMSAFREFLQSRPGSLRVITVVVYEHDTWVVGKFADALKKVLGRDTHSVLTALPSSAIMTSYEETDISTLSETSYGPRRYRRPQKVRGLPSVIRQKEDKIPKYWTESLNRSNGGVHLTPATAEERAAVEDLVRSTWEADKVGRGADARGLEHRAIQVTKVERLENPEVWRGYNRKREELFHKLKSPLGSTACCTSVESLSSRGQVKTTINVNKAGALCREIYAQVNEHYLFHGTKRNALAQIYTQGLTLRAAKKKNMLGPGLYATESSTKADQYTDPKHARKSGEELTMILMRVLLGEPFLHQTKNPPPIKRPPCMKCSQWKCYCTDCQLFDSIIDDVRLFREFVVYEDNACYPEYFITYTRI